MLLSVRFGDCRMLSWLFLLDILSRLSRCWELLDHGEIWVWRLMICDCSDSHSLWHVVDVLVHRSSCQGVLLRGSCGIGLPDLKRRLIVLLGSAGELQVLFWGALGDLIRQQFLWEHKVLTANWALLNQRICRFDRIIFQLWLSLRRRIPLISLL